MSEEEPKESKVIDKFSVNKMSYKGTNYISVEDLLMFLDFDKNHTDNETIRNYIDQLSKRLEMLL